MGETRLQYKSCLFLMDYLLIKLLCYWMCPNADKYELNTLIYHKNSNKCPHNLSLRGGKTMDQLWSGLYFIFICLLFFFNSNCTVLDVFCFPSRDSVSTRQKKKRHIWTFIKSCIILKLWNSMFEFYCFSWQIYHQPFRYLWMIGWKVLATKALYTCFPGMETL